MSYPWGKDHLQKLLSKLTTFYWQPTVSCSLYKNQLPVLSPIFAVKSSWNVTAHGDARVGKWRWNWRMEWVASTLHTTSEHGVTSVTTADAHTSAASRRLNWRPRRFKWTRPFRRKTKSGFCACAITFQLASTTFPIPFTGSILILSLYLCPCLQMIFVSGFYSNIICLFIFSPTRSACPFNLTYFRLKVCHLCCVNAIRKQYNNQSIHNTSLL